MTEQTAQTASAIVWFELPAADSERAQDFYGQLLGWRFEPFGEQNYHLSNEAGGAIDGTRREGGILVYFGVADISEARSRVLDLGGSAGEVQQIPGIGLYAICNDTEGTSFGLYQNGADE
jgi:uncharacterized protein